MTKLFAAFLEGQLFSCTLHVGISHMYVFHVHISKANTWFHACICSTVLTGGHSGPCMLDKEQVRDLQNVNRKRSYPALSLRQPCLFGTLSFLFLRLPFWCVIGSVETSCSSNETNYLDTYYLPFFKYLLQDL